MKGGHNRKPTALKILQGTNRPSRNAVNEAVIEGEVNIAPPPEFKGVDLAVWNEAAPLLKEAGILTRADLAQLKNYCQHWAVIEEASKHIITLGVMIGSPQGIKKNPACTALNEASAQMRALSATLGLDPSSRARLNISKPKAPVKGGFADI